MNSFLLLSGLRNISKKTNCQYDRKCDHCNPRIDHAEIHANRENESRERLAGGLCDDGHTNDRAKDKQRRGEKIPVMTVAGVMTAESNPCVNIVVYGPRFAGACPVISGPINSLSQSVNVPSPATNIKIALPRRGMSEVTLLAKYCVSKVVSAMITAKRLAENNAV